MKTLCPAVLGLEVVVLLLAIPVVLSLTSAGASGGWAMAVLGALALVTAGLFRRRPGLGLRLGWAVQVLVVASGLLVPAMFAVGTMFAGVWALAVHYGGRVDRMRG